VIGPTEAASHPVIPETPLSSGQREPVSDDSHSLHREKRDRRAQLNIYSGLIAKIAGIALRLITLPLSIAILGQTRYGLWLTIGSLLGWLALADLGIAPGLQNIIGISYGLDDKIAIRRHVSTSFYVYSGLALLAIIAIVGIRQWPALPSLFGISSDPILQQDARNTVFVAGLIFALSLALSTVINFSWGLQEGFKINLLNIGSSILSLGLLALMRMTHDDSMVRFCLAANGPVLFGTVVLGIFLFFFTHRDFLPLPRYCNLESLRLLFSYAGPLFLVQLGDLAIVYVANLVIAHRLGPAEVPKYAVPYALLSSVAAIVTSFAYPYSPAVIEAAVRGDWHWIQESRLKLFKITALIFGSATIFIAIWGRAAIILWLRMSSPPGQAILMAMCFYFLFISLANTSGNFLVSLNLIRPRLILKLSSAALHLVVFFIIFPRFGILAIPLGGGMVLLAETLIAQFLIQHTIQSAGRPFDPAPQAISIS
jgi:O-antigen/teichoic acid export membrane protein